MTTLNLVQSSKYRCHCGDEIWQLETIKGRKVCSKICKQCNPWWRVTATDFEFRKARKQADELQAKGESA